MSKKCMKRTSKLLFRLGQILLTWGEICFFVAIGTSYWVIRPTVDYQKQNISPNMTVVINYGIFRACRQDDYNPASSTDSNKCGQLWDYLTIINVSTARYIQFVMCMAVVFYAAGVILEFLQCLPVENFRNFIAKNRMVEAFAGVATVLVLKGMVIFAGEIKSKADRMTGQDDEQPGWSFFVAVIGLLLCVLGLLLAVMFRDLPNLGPGKIGGSWLRPASSSKT